MAKGVREPIKASDTMMDVMVKMSEGNPGALTVLMQLWLREHGPELVLDLDDMGVRGSSIWVGYKDYCEEDLERFALCITMRDSEMMKVIHKEAELEKKYSSA